MTIEQVKEHYEQDILAIMERHRQACESQGWYVSPIDDLTDDEYRWGMEVCRRGYNPAERGEDWQPDVDFGIQFTITEAVIRDGEPEDGINFMIDSVFWGGRCGTQYCPHNYTPEIWVSRNDPAAVEARFELMRQCDAESLPRLIMELS